MGAPARLGPAPWHSTEVIQLFPKGRAHSLWVVRNAEHSLLGWYVNLEDPQVLGGRTITTQDHVLDIWVPGRDGRARVEGRGRARGGGRESGRFSADEAASIRAEGERVWAERPWPTGWEEWLPPAEWATTGAARRLERGLTVTMSRRFPTLLAFVTLGLFWGAWASVLPDVQRATGVSKGALGIALLCVALGSIPSMLFIAGPRSTGTAAGRWPSPAPSSPRRRRCRPGGVAAAARARAARRGRVHRVSLDVGINANAGRLEAESGRRIMPLAHGLYSVGILVGAVGAGLARSAGAHRETILLAVAVLIALTAALLGTERIEPAPSEGRHTIRIERALLGLGILCAVAFVVEGGIESWSALFLERELDASPAVSGLGPGVFGASMAVGRFYGQGTRLGERTLLVGSGLLAAGGCFLAAVSPSAPVALVGLALGGAGVALYAPIVFGCRRQARRERGRDGDHARLLRVAGRARARRRRRAGDVAARVVRRAGARRRCGRPRSPARQARLGLEA